MRTERATVADSVERVAVVSDLHSYGEALRACDAFIRSLPGSRQVCVNGDLFEGGVDVVETIDWVMAHARGFTTRGNHDYALLDPSLEADDAPDTEAYAARALREDQRDFVRALPEQIILTWRGRTIRMLHGHITPEGAPGEWMWTPDKLQEAFSDARYDITVLGHTHFPFVRGNIANSGSTCIPIRQVFLPDGSVHFQSGDPTSKDNTDLRSSLLSITHRAGGLHTEVLRFDYDKRAAIEKFRSLPCRHSLARKERRLLEGTTEV